MEFENQHPHENVALNVLLMRMRATGLVDDADDADADEDADDDADGDDTDDHEDNADDQDAPAADVASSHAAPAPSGAAAVATASAGDWQAVFSPPHNAYYFYNTVTQDLI